jgi:hypothetical protein
MTDRGAASPAVRIPAWSIALLVFGASFLLLELWVGPPPLHEDTARDLLIARDCVDAGRCAMSGPTTSFGGLTQGALWIHVLEVSRAAGLGLRGVRAIVLGLASAAAVLIAFTPRRFCGWSAGPAAWAVSLAAIAATIELPTLWNPSALPLPLSLFHVALISLAATGGARLAGAVGIALALAIDAHVVCAVLLPFTLGVLVATAERPVLATCVAGVLLVGTALVSSVGAVMADFPILIAAWWPSSVALAVSLLLGLAMRRRARAASATGRVRAVLVAACGYFVATAVLAVVATRHPLAPRYIAPIVPAAAILAAGAAIGAFGRRPPGPRRALAGNVAVVLAVALVALFARRPPRQPQWTALDAEALAPSLSARGWTFGDLYSHLRGPQAHALLAALGPSLPAPDGTPHLHALDDLLLLKAPRSRVQASGAEEWILADLSGQDVAVGRRAPSWLDPGSIEVCAGPPGSSVRCVLARLVGHDPDRGARGTFSQRAYPELEGVRPTLLSGEERLTGPVHWTLAVRLRPHIDEPSHTLTLAEPDRRWRVERVEGALHRGALPSREVTLESVTGEGRIVFAVDLTADETKDFRPWLPDMIETAASEDGLRALSSDASGGPR